MPSHHSEIPFADGKLESLLAIHGKKPQGQLRLFERLELGEIWLHFDACSMWSESTLVGENNKQIGRTLTQKSGRVKQLFDELLGLGPNQVDMAMSESGLSQQAQTALRQLLAHAVDEQASEITRAIYRG